MKSKLSSKTSELTNEITTDENQSYAGSYVEKKNSSGKFQSKECNPTIYSNNYAATDSKSQKGPLENNYNRSQSSSMSNPSCKEGQWDSLPYEGSTSKQFRTDQCKGLPPKNAVKRNSTVIIKSSRPGIEPQSMRARAGSVSKLISKFEGLSAAPCNPIKAPDQGNETSALSKELNSENTASLSTKLPILNVSTEEASSECTSNSQKEPIKYMQESNENSEHSSFKPVIRFTFLKDRSISPRRLDPNPIQESEAFKALCRDIQESSSTGFNRQSYRSLPSFSSSTSNKTVIKSTGTPTKSMPRLSTSLSPGAIEAKHIIQLRHRRDGAIQRSFSLNDNVSLVKDTIGRNQGHDTEQKSHCKEPAVSKIQDSVADETSSLSPHNSPKPDLDKKDLKQSTSDSHQSLQMSATRRRILESLVRLRMKKATSEVPFTEITDASQRTENSHDCTLSALPSPVRVRSGLLKSAFVRSGSAPPTRLGQLFGEEWAEKMQQKHTAGHGGLTSEDAGSEFYQTQDPDSTSEYDPSQTTTQARVVTTRTLTRTVMGEDGRPVSVTTTETEVSDGGGAEGVLDSNQLRESMQQIIDQFAAGEETKEGKEGKKEKKPE